MPQSCRPLGAIVLAISARYDDAAASGEWPTAPRWATPRTQIKPASQRPEVGQ
jgi:hypothetical protein